MHTDNNYSKKLYESILNNCKAEIKKYKNISNFDVVFILNDHKIAHTVYKSEEGFLYLKFPSVDYNYVCNLLQKHKFISAVPYGQQKAVKIKAEASTTEVQKIRNAYIYKCIINRYLNEAQHLYGKYFSKKKEKLMSDDERSLNKTILKDNVSCVGNIKALIK